MPDRNTYCILFTRRITTKQPQRPHGTGRAHDRCVKAFTRGEASLHIAIPRKKHPYNLLQPTQQWKRRKQAQEAVTQVLDTIDVPLQAIVPSSIPSPAELLHLSTSVREQIRPIHTFTPHSMRADDYLM